MPTVTRRYPSATPNVKTDEQLIDKFLTRGVEKIYPTPEELKKKLKSGDRIRVYQGFDPTGPYLHVGHAMGIRALRILQQLGHEVIFLVGDFTSRVGDPDKNSARKMLTVEEIQANMNGWKEQASYLIEFEGENPVQFKQNFEWLSKLRFEDIIELMSHATVQQMLEREMFQRRMKENDSIGLQEFIYPLMQGYDGVAMEVDMEIGGTDQTFNMLMGRQLSKAYLGKEKFVRTNELMDAPDQLTMSKTKGNGINLSDSSEDMFGKAMSYPDHLITKGLRLLTDVATEDIWQIEKQMEAGENPMQYKKLMAFEIVKVIKGENAAKQAQEHFEKTVQKGEVDMQNAIEVPVTVNETIFEIIKNANIENVSGSEIRRVIEQAGVEINNQKVTDPNQKTQMKTGDIIKFGKRIFLRVK